MKKYLILQNAEDKKYWYGHYSNKQWTDNIKEAKRFASKQELKEFIRLYSDEALAFVLLIVIPIYI